MPGNSRSERLRVAVLVESLTVPEWVAWTVARIDAMEAFELAAVLPATGALCAVEARRLLSLTYRMYEWLDSRVFGRAGAMRDADLTPISSGRMTLEGVDSLDVVVSFVPADRMAWDGPPPRHGVWAIVPMDDGRPTSAPIRFWEVRGRTGAATTAVAAVGDGVTRVIAQGSARADPLSLARTRHAAAWASAHLVLRSLRSLHLQGHWVPARADLADARGPPSPAATVRHAARTALRGVAARSRTAWRRGEWFVAVRATIGRRPRRGSRAGAPEPAGALPGRPVSHRGRAAATTCSWRTTPMPRAGR